MIQKAAKVENYRQRLREEPGNERHRITKHSCCLVQLVPAALWGHFLEETPVTRRQEAASVNVW